VESLWFTADLHLLHPKIVEYCRRPIDPELHDKWIIDRINERVSKKDTLYILGDLSMANRKDTEELVSTIRGRKHLILGNHDKNLKNSTYFESISQIKVINPTILEGKRLGIVLCHYPIGSWEGKIKGSYHFYGHTHGRFKNPGLSWDVGIDNNDYYPLELNEIINLIKEIENGKVL
jgi:calcineurin-like phosphoesterase family protein